MSPLVEHSLCHKKVKHRGELSTFSPRNLPKCIVSICLKNWYALCYSRSFHLWICKLVVFK